MSPTTILGDPIVPGHRVGPVLNLERPLSFWGGVDAQTGRVTDFHHPQHGQVVTGRVLVLPAGRGSSSSSSALLECVRAGTAPAALLLHHVDPILPVGAAVAIELYGRGPAVVRIEPGERLPDGAIAGISRSGAVTVDLLARPVAPGDAARLYHRLTSYDSGRDLDVPVDDPRVLQDFEADVLERFPAHCKTYPGGLPVVELPRRWPVGGGSATAVLARRHTAPTATPTLQGLARMLHLSAGVVRLAERRDGRRYRFRAAGSAGGQFPFELYVAARGVAGLDDGVHWFDPIAHALVQVAPAPHGEATTLIVAGTPWRTGWRYRERSLRHLYWDAGAILANLLAVAEDAGLAPGLRTVFPDGEVTALVGADAVQEFPLAIVTLGPGAPAIRPGGTAAAGEVDRRAPVEFALVTAVQHAGDGDRLGSPWPAAAPLQSEPPDSAGLDEVILRRISTRVMDPSRSVGRDAFEWMLSAALRGSRVPHFVAVHAVEGLEPGLYRVPVLVAPLRPGDLRGELFGLSAEQALTRDAAFVAISAVDADRLDDRGYREVQLDAGLVSGRLQLAAFALGVGATGMTFIDSELPALLGEPLAGLLLTCVGVPTYRHRLGGPPGAPIEMRPLKQPAPDAVPSGAARSSPG